MNTYAHMCRDEHAEIGHRDSESERCPLCRAHDFLEWMAEQGVPPAVQTATWDFLESEGRDMKWRRAGSTSNDAHLP